MCVVARHAPLLVWARSRWFSHAPRNKSPRAAPIEASGQSNRAGGRRIALATSRRMHAANQSLLVVHGTRWHETRSRGTRNDGKLRMFERECRPWIPARHLYRDGIMPRCAMMRPSMRQAPSGPKAVHFNVHTTCTSTSQRAFHWSKVILLFDWAQRRNSSRPAATEDHGQEGS